MLWVVGLWKFFTGSRLGQIAGLGLLALVAWGSFKGYVKVQRWDAAREERIRVLTKLADDTQKESDRRQKVIDAARVIADSAAKRILDLEGTLAKKQEEIDRESRKNDGKPCLDPRALLRLDGLRNPNPH